MLHQRDGVIFGNIPQRILPEEEVCHPHDKKPAVRMFLYTCKMKRSEKSTMKTLIISITIVFPLNEIFSLVVVTHG